MAEDIALRKEKLLRLTVRIEDFEKKLEQQITTKNIREDSSGEEGENSVEEVTICEHLHLNSISEPASLSTRSRKHGKESQEEHHAVTRAPLVQQMQEQKKQKAKKYRRRGRNWGRRRRRNRTIRSNKMKGKIIET